MILFLLKGLMRDHHRSLFPVIIVSLGVLLTTLLYSFMSGVLNDLIDASAKFDTGHLKVTTRAYQKLSGQLPNDLALTGADTLINRLSKEYPGYEWTARIKFAGLLDVPDEHGETKAQDPVFGMAMDLLGRNSHEAERLNLTTSIVRGRMPRKPGDVLISDQFARRLGIGIDQPITLLSSSSSGGMAVQNFRVCGTVQFGITAMDRGAMIADLADIQYALEMPGGAAEILGFNRNRFYVPEEAANMKNSFNSRVVDPHDQYAPVMVTLEDQNGLGEYLRYADAEGFLIVGIFLATMCVVLLNTGLMSGIRRYGEVGVRLALGEPKDGIYRTLLYESVLIGIAGSVIGTSLGLAASYYFQEVGLNMSGALRNSSIMLSNVVRARISLTSVYIGFIPGLLATLLGTALSGIQIFKRQTASLFKELEA
jgi:putative ABC transport system permease protein